MAHSDLSGPLYSDHRLEHRCILKWFPGVKTEEIRKGRISTGSRDIWRVLLEILPLQKSKEKRRQT